MSLDDNPLFKRARKRGDNGHGDSSEKRVIKSMGGRLNPSSGAMRGAKSDGQVHKRKSYRVECKSTVKPTLPVELGWLVKIATEALAQGQEPILTVSFVQPDGKAKNHGDWVMMPKYLFDELSE